MIYTVGPGDSLSTIARDHGITLEALLDTNPQYKANPDSVLVGATLQIPEREPRPPDTSSGSAGTKRTLGKLSEKYETGGRGPGTVSSGVGDPGGVSYGSYQMTSKNGGTVARFVAQAEFRWRDEFRNLTPGSPEFSATWRAIAAAYPEEFQEAQHAYIKTTYFDVLVAKLRDEVGFDATSRSYALQDVIWSTAVQHGPNTPVVHRALDSIRLAGALNLADREFDGQLIQAIYAERGRRNAQGELVYFAHSSHGVQESVARRFVEEERDALEMLANEYE
jgi:LysM repeat protein